MSRFNKGLNEFVRVLRGYAACGFPTTRDSVRRLLYPKDEWTNFFGSFAEFRRVAKV